MMETQLLKDPARSIPNKNLQNKWPETKVLPYSIWCNIIISKVCDTWKQENEDHHTVFVNFHSTGLFLEVTLKS